MGEHKQVLSQAHTVKVCVHQEHIFGEYTHKLQIESHDSDDKSPEKSLPWRQQLFDRKNKHCHCIVSCCVHSSYADISFQQTNEFSTLAQAVNILWWTTELASFSVMAWFNKASRENKIKDSSCSQPSNTLRNNDNSDDREQAGYWLNTKAVLTGPT